jgi:tetratricopeptide (TPR) repeat protein
MSRFAHLEISGEEPAAEPAAGNVEVRDERYWLSQADALYRKARFERALRLYSRSLELNANDPAGWVGQIRMLGELGEYSEARLWADKALEVHRDHPDLLAGKAIALARAGQTADALGYCDAAAGAAGMTPLLWLARGEVLAATEQRTAEHSFRQAQTLTKGDWFTAALAARVYALYGQWPRSLAWAREALQLSPAEPLAWVVQADAEAALGMAGAAQSSYERAVSLDELIPGGMEGIRRMAKGGGTLRQLWNRIRGR